MAHECAAGATSILGEHGARTWSVGRRHCSSAHGPVGYSSPARGGTKGGHGVRRPWRPWLAVLAVLAGVGGLAALLATAAWRLGRARPAEDTLPAARLSVAAALRAPDTQGFARALDPRPFVFPADHGSHPDYRTEWWYYTGNLASRDGRRFGFQLTFFRTALAPGPPAGAAAGRTSAWAARQVWFAHFAVTDGAGHRFLAYERWERQALGLAGAEAAPFRVWVGPWSAAAAGPEV